MRRAGKDVHLPRLARHDKSRAGLAQALTAATPDAADGSGWVALVPFAEAVAPGCKPAPTPDGLVRPLSDSLGAVSAGFPTLAEHLATLPEVLRTIPEAIRLVFLTRLPMPRAARLGRPD